MSETATAENLPPGADVDVDADVADASANVADASANVADASASADADSAAPPPPPLPAEQDQEQEQDDDPRIAAEAARLERLAGKIRGAAPLYRTVLHLPVIVFLFALLHLCLQPMKTRARVVNVIGDVYAPLAGNARRASRSALSFFNGGDDQEGSFSWCPQSLEQSWQIGLVEGKIRERGCTSPSGLGSLFSSSSSSMSEEETDRAVASKCPELLQEAAAIVHGVQNNDGHMTTAPANSPSPVLKWSHLVKAKGLARKRDLVNAKGGLVSRILGFLTFTRVLWFVAILGMASTLLPALAVFLEITGLRYILQLLGGKVFAVVVEATKALIKFLVRALVLHPVARLFHQPLALALSYLFFIHALGYYHHTSIDSDDVIGGLMADESSFVHAEARKGALVMTMVMAALGSCFAVIWPFPNPPVGLFICASSSREMEPASDVALLVYSGSRRDNTGARRAYANAASEYEDALKATSGARKSFSVASSSCAVVLFAAAYMSQNQFPLTCIGVLLAYQALGFVCGAFGGGYFLGFSGEGAVGRSVLGSALVTVASISTRVLLRIPSINAVEETITLDRVLFKGAVDANSLGKGLQFTLGPAQKLSQIIFFLGMLIMADRHFGSSAWDRASGSGGYWRAQLRMIGALLISLYVGAVYGAEVDGLGSLFTTSLVFSCLYAMDKSVDWGLWTASSAAFLMFASSLSLWRMALFLHQRPELVVGLVDEGAGKRAVTTVLQALTTPTGGVGSDCDGTTLPPLFTTLDKACFAFTCGAFGLIAALVLTAPSKTTTMQRR